MDEILSLRWVGNGGMWIGGEGRKCAAVGGWMTFGVAVEKAFLCFLAALRSN